MSLRPGDFLINDETDNDLLMTPLIDGERKSHGLVPRDFQTHPLGMFAPPTEIPLIPRSEWSDRIKEQAALRTRISDMRGSIPSLDQDGVGYCWAHSSTSAVTMVRAINNMPYVPLSAFSVAATIKKGADEGGWCGLSAKFVREKGVMSQAVWPQGDRNYRKYDKPENWENAALHKATEEFVDLTHDVYDTELTFDQTISCLLCGIPCAVDFNWWSHSVCAIDAVEVEAGSFGIRILNSWSDSWGEKGTGVLQGKKAVPDSGVAFRVVRASNV
jgi:hypothetical protein